MVVLLKGGTGADADESKKQTFYILNSSQLHQGIHIPNSGKGVDHNG